MDKRVKIIFLLILITFISNFYLYPISIRSPKAKINLKIFPNGSYGLPLFVKYLGMIKVEAENEDSIFTGNATYTEVTIKIQNGTIVDFNKGVGNLLDLTITI